MTESLSSRSTALEILQAVLRRNGTLDEAASGHLGFAKLEPRDRAFVRLLVATSLRRLGQIDALIAVCLERPVEMKMPAVHDILRLGIAQLLFLKTPPHAAVDTSVALAEEVGHGALKGLVNAVLRRLSREGATIVDAQDAAKLNTPGWLWESWIAAYGEGTARKIAEAHMAEPPLDITVKSHAESHRESWASRLSAAILPTGSLRRPIAQEGGGGAIPELPGFAEGEWWVQDAAAAIPASLFGNITGRSAIDLCAAPGGKTAQLAAAGAKVTAVDVSATRIKLLRENMNRLHLPADFICADASVWHPREKADCVLLDAPCTATGTLRRHPDIARLKSPKDVTRLMAVQDRLLDAATAMLATGGTLVYCTCSLQPEEGEQRIAALLDRKSGLVRVPIAPPDVGGLAELLTAEGALRTLPCHLSAQGGMDGFYAARLRRVA
jgi:16S rRNA (cytosine967-C5)-methyltransferase